MVLQTDPRQLRPQPAYPEDNLPRITIFQFVSHPVLDDCVAGATEGLRAKGLAADRGIRLRFYNAENDSPPTANGIVRACRRCAPSSLPGFPIGQEWRLRKKVAGKARES